MRKLINISALILFVWLLLDALNIPSMFIYFLLVGDLPGTTVSLSPTVMLAIMTLTGGTLLFEYLARRVEVVWRIRRSLMHIALRRERLPKRRFHRA